MATTNNAHPVETCPCGICASVRRLDYLWNNDDFVWVQVSRELLDSLQEWSPPVQMRMRPSDGHVNVEVREILTRPYVKTATFFAVCAHGSEWSSSLYGLRTVQPLTPLTQFRTVQPEPILEVCIPATGDVIHKCKLRELR